MPGTITVPFSLIKKVKPILKEYGYTLQHADEREAEFFNEDFHEMHSALIKDKLKDKGIPFDYEVDAEQSEIYFFRPEHNGHSMKEHTIYYDYNGHAYITAAELTQLIQLDGESLKAKLKEMIDDLYGNCIPIIEWDCQ